MQNREFKIFAAIADIHIGVKHISAVSLKKQLKKHFIKVLKNMKHLDGIFICGDILHTIVSLNSDYAELYLWFIDQVYKVAKKQNAVVIIIKGTASHDNDQLQNIKSYIDNDDGVDFRIYETVEEITLWKNYKVLVLPDVKVKQLKDIDKYLTEDKKYDLILGHGLINTMRFFVQDSENMPTKTYEFDVDKLNATCKGPILFGHIHQFQSVRDQFYYIGPFTLLERGGINAGFIIGGIYDKDRTKYIIEQYENPDSAHYFDIDITEKILKQFPIDEIIEAIDDIISDAKENDLISLRITRGDELESADKVVMLETRYRKDSRFSIVKKIKSKQDEEAEKESQVHREKFAYLIDKNIEMADMFYRYYIEEFVPSLADKFSPVAKIKEEDFRRILES